MQPTEKYPAHFRSFGCSEEQAVETDVESPPEDANKFSGLVSIPLGYNNKGFTVWLGLGLKGFKGYIMLSNLTVRAGGFVFSGGCWRWSWHGCARPGSTKAQIVILTINFKGRLNLGIVA